MAQEANRCPGCWRGLPMMEENQTPNFCPHCQFPLKPVAGLYRLESKLGAGAFGTVYRSHHVHYGTMHAVKIMRWDVVEELAPDYWGRKQKLDKQREFEHRFQREVQLTTELAEDSWHIVRIQDAGSDPVHGLYYVMELLEGAPLSQFVQQWPAMSRRIAFSVMEQVCLAMSAAHRKGVIHRDLKPENIIILQKEDAGRFVKILDFGIAKVLGNRKTNLTSRPVGTPLYMAPEQCANREVDQRTDIYALGCLFYHLITGAPPFGEDLEIPQLMLKHVQVMPPTLQERCPDLPIPAGLDRAVMRALAKAPEARYTNVEQFWAAVHPYSQWQEEGQSEVVGADTVISPSIIEPAPVDMPPPPETDWSVGSPSWSAPNVITHTREYWDEQYHRRSRFGVSGLMFVALLLAALWWFGSRHTPSSSTKQAALMPGTSQTAARAPSARTGASTFQRPSPPRDVAKKPTQRLGLSQKGMVASRQSQGDSSGQSDSTADDPSRKKTRLSRLERFLRKARLNRERRTRTKRVVTARKKSAAPKVRPRRRVVRPRPRPRMVRQARPGRPSRIASVTLSKLAGWPGAQRVGVSPGQVQAGLGSTSSQAPAGRVLSLRRGFWMWRTEVTQGQFQSLMGYNPSHFQNCGKNCPVENVSWHEAAAFCNALSKQQGKPECFECTGKGRNAWCMVKRAYWGKQYYRCKGWRLPTEAEWEYAYRAGASAPYYSGKCLPSSQANYNGQLSVADCPKGRHRNRTMPVGSFSPNAWGMYDMAGNVWEWVYDSYQASLPSGRNAVRIGSSRRVVRGGGWYSSASECSATARDSFSADKRGIILGFRPTRTR